MTLGRGGQQPEQRQRQRGLAAAGLPGDAELLPGLHPQVDPAYGGDGTGPAAVRHRQVPHLRSGGSRRA